jgi:DNA-directed RNA polymerase specialized sigma24 family protein
MNTVALPSSAGAARRAAPDLVRQAARGDSEAFAELYRLHAEPAWRLAQSVAPDADAARRALVEGFTKTLRASRRGRSGLQPFRIALLANVYRAAADHALDRPAAPAPRRAGRGSAEEVMAEAAFRSLPERWRATLWLTEAEGFTLERLAAVLGVSVGVADQLLARSRKGLANRYAQARQEVPGDFGDLLRRRAVEAPADLAGATAAGWSEAGSDHVLAALAPLSEWLNERGVRPLAVAAGTLIGIGLVGLGVVPGSGSVHNQLYAGGAGAVTGAVPLSYCSAAGCLGGAGGPAATAGGTAGSANAFTAAFDQLVNNNAASPPGGTLATGTGGSGAIAGGGSTGAGGSAPTAPTAPTGSGPGGGGSTTSPPPGSSGGGTELGLPLGLGTISVTSTGTVSASLLGGTAQATLGSCGVSVSVGTAGAGTCPPPTASSGTGGPTTAGSPSGGTSSPLAPVTQTLNSTVSTATNVVSGTVNSLSATVGSVTSTLSGTLSSLTGGGAGTSSGTSKLTSGLASGL